MFYYLGAASSHNAAGEAPPLPSAAYPCSAPLGVNCRICPRTACPERAFPPLDRAIVLDPNRRDVVPFSVRE